MSGSMSSEASAEPNLTPMLDLVFQLITFFMLTTAFSKPNVIVLPEGVIFETVHYRKDGTVMNVEVSSQGADYNDQRVLISIIRDITDRKKNEQLIEENNSKINAILESTSHIIFALDTEFRYIAFNPTHKARMKEHYNIDISLNI